MHTPASETPPRLLEKPHTWQDWVLAIGQTLFLVALFPSILGPDKPAWETSLLTALTLSVFSFTFATLKLRYGAITSALVAIGWWVLFVQVVL